MADTTPSTPYGSPYFSSVKADNIDPQSNIGAGDTSVPLSDVADVVTSIGKPNGVATLDQDSQLILHGKSALGVTPATAASGTTPATPAKLKPLLPLDETATVGDAGNTLGDAVSQAAGAVQADGGDASNTKIKSAAGTVARVASDRAADMLHVQDFGPDGTAAGDTAAFIAADTACAAGQPTGIMRISPGSTITGNVSDALAAANRTVVLGAGELNGFRRRQASAEYLPTPTMFPATVRPEHLKRLSVAVASGTLRVAVMGDSIPSIGDNLISTADHPMFTWIDEIKKQNPTVDVQFKNMAIGGQTWGGMWSDSTSPPAWFDNDDKLSWKAFVAAYNPDLLLLYSGGNDGYGFDAVAMHKLVSYFQTAANFSSGNVPDLIFGCTYQPSLGSAVNGYNQTVTQNGIDFVSTYIRNYAIANNYGYLDFARWHAMCRDGIDIRELVMERVQPVAGTTLPAYEQAVATTNNNWAFPAATTGIGVSAQSCTSWLINFTIDADMGVLQVPLSNASSNPLTPTTNPLFIVNDGGKIKCTYCDGVTRDVVAKTSTIAWPTGASSWTIVVKDGRLRVEVQQPLDNGWDISNQGAHVMGMGYVCIFDENVARFGAPYAPQLKFANAVNVTVHNLCVADATTIQGSGHRGSSQRFRPIVSDYELYVENDSQYGGSGSYHMNAYGYRLIMAPVIRAQNWSRPVLGYAEFNGFKSDGNSSIDGTLSCSNLGYFNNSWIGASNWNSEGAYVTYLNDATNLVVSRSAGGTVNIISHDTATGKDTVLMQGNPDGSINLAKSLTSLGDGWFDCKSALNVENWIKCTSFLCASGSISAWGASAIGAQPVITGTKPTDPIVQQILSVLAACGFVKDSTT